MQLKIYLALLVLGYVGILGRCDDPLLLWTQKSYIWSKIKGLQGRPDDWLPLKLKPYVQSETYREGYHYAIAYNPSTDEVIWSDLQDNNILKQHLQGNVYRAKDGVKQLYVEENAEISSLAVDWFSNSVYFINRVAGSIGIQSLDAEKVNINKILFSGENQEPVSLAVDPYEGLIFWTNAAKSSLEVARPNDNSSSILVEGLNNLHGITLDMSSKTVFYIDGNMINRVDYNGRNSETIWASSTDHKYFDMTLMEDHLLVSTGNNLQIHVHSRTSGEFVGSADIDAEIYHIVAAESLTIPPHACNSLNCQHICLNLGINAPAQCVCADGFTLDADGKSCVITPVPAQEAEDNDLIIIAGAAAAAVLFLLLLGLLFCCLAVRKCRKDKTKDMPSSVSQENFPTPDNAPESHVYANEEMFSQIQHVSENPRQPGNVGQGVENGVPIMVPPIIPVFAPPKKVDKSFKSRISSHSSKKGVIQGQQQGSRPGSAVDSDGYEVPSPEDSPPPSSTVSLSSIQSTTPLASSNRHSRSNNFQLHDSKNVATVIQRLTNRLRKGLSSIRFNEAAQRRPGIDTSGNEDQPVDDNEQIPEQIRSYPETAKSPPNKRMIHIPRKLHKEPRGWAPASHNVPRNVISTLGRAKGKAVAQEAN